MATELMWNELDYPWSYAVTQDGRIFFINDVKRATTWLHPRTHQPVQTGYLANHDFPVGWESGVTPEGALYYIDHNQSLTTFFHPVTGQTVAADQKPRLDDSPTEPIRGFANSACIPASTNPVHYHSTCTSNPANNQLRPTNFVKKPAHTKRAVVDRAPSARSTHSKNEVSRRGWLMKQDTGGLRTWRTRWCVLADYCLFYYKDDDEREYDGSVLLPSYKVNPCTRDDNISKKFAFKIEHENMQTEFFATETKENLQEWMNALSLATILQRDARATKSLLSNGTLRSIGDRVPPVEGQFRPLDENSNALAKNISSDSYGTFDKRANVTPYYGDNFQGFQQDSLEESDSKAGVYRTSGFVDLSNSSYYAPRQEIVQDDSHSDSVFDVVDPNISFSSVEFKHGQHLDAKQALKLWHQSSDSVPRADQGTDRVSTSDRSQSQCSERSPTMRNYQISLKRRPQNRSISSSDSHIYENIPTDGDDAPSRPPFPAAYRGELIREMALSRTPNTRTDFELVAESELRRAQSDVVFQFPNRPQRLGVENTNQRSSLAQSDTGPYDDTVGTDGERRSFATVAHNTDAENPDMRPTDSPLDKPINGPQNNMRNYSVPPQSPSNRRLQRNLNPLVNGDFHTIKEDPSMSDSQILDTRRSMRKCYSVSPLNGHKPRLSITAADLVGKSHEELVLLLIQLRRDRANLEQTRVKLKEMVDQRKDAERRYQSMVTTGVEIDDVSEEEHDYFLHVKARQEETENQLDVHKPLINLVDNLVKMGSLYNGQNSLLFSQYKKHLLSPGQQPDSKRMLEFTRRLQEDRLTHEQEDELKHLREEEVDLNEATQRLHDLDARLQELSVLVRSLREDKALLERALAEVTSDERRYCDDQYQMERLAADKDILDRQLSDVLQQLADQSMNLEEVGAENHKVEMEVMLLRSKIFQMTKSHSLPALSGESFEAKEQLMGDLTIVKDIMHGLNERGQQLSQAMDTLRRSQPDLTTVNVNGSSGENKSLRGSTYLETDLNSMVTRDIAVDKMKKRAQPKSSIKRSYSEREIRPDAKEFPPRGRPASEADDRGRSRSKNLRDVKRQSERRSRGQRYEHDSPVKRSQSLPRFFAGNRSESPEMVRRYTSNQSFGSTHALPANQLPANQLPDRPHSIAIGRQPQASPTMGRKDFHNRSANSLRNAAQYSSLPRSVMIGHSPSANHIPRSSSMMGSLPRESRSFTERSSSQRKIEPLSPQAHRRPTGYQDVNQMSPIIQHRIPSSPSSPTSPREKLPEYPAGRFEPVYNPDLRHRPPSPRNRRKGQQPPRIPGAPAPSKGRIPDYQYDRVELTEVTADSPSVLEHHAVNQSMNSLQRSQQMNSLRSNYDQPISAGVSSVSGGKRQSWPDVPPRDPRILNGNPYGSQRSASYRVGDTQGHSDGTYQPQDYNDRSHLVRNDPQRSDSYQPHYARGPARDDYPPPRPQYPDLSQNNGRQLGQSYAQTSDQKQSPRTQEHFQYEQRYGASYRGRRDDEPSPRSPRERPQPSPRSASVRTETIRHTTPHNAAYAPHNDAYTPHNDAYKTHNDAYVVNQDRWSVDQKAPAPYERTRDVYDGRHRQVTSGDAYSEDRTSFDRGRSRERQMVAHEDPQQGMISGRTRLSQSDMSGRERTSSAVRRDTSRERSLTTIGGSNVGSYSPRLAARHRVAAARDNATPSGDDSHRGTNGQVNHIQSSAPSGGPNKLELDGVRLNGRAQTTDDNNEMGREYGAPRHGTDVAPQGGWRGKEFTYGDTVIDREVLMAPSKVEIPERYVPESEIDDLSENERMTRQDKAEKLKKMLSAQSLQDWRRGEIEGPGRRSIHERVSEERKRRETVLELRQELAHQVTQVSKQVAVEANERQRRKTLTGDDSDAITQVTQANTR